MNNLKKINKFDPVIERFISSHDKPSIKKTLAFEYFNNDVDALNTYICLLYTSPSPRDRTRSRMPSSA